MNFLLTAQIDKNGGLDRRAACRDQHIKQCDALRDSGNFLYGVATLGPDNQMTGSVMVMNFSNSSELNNWLKTEPYVTNNVWKNIKITPCMIGPSFTDKEVQK